MIWKQSFTLDGLNAMNKNTLGEVLGMEFIAFTDDSLSIKMPVDHRTHQPMGLLHGGASAALAETVGSVASVLCLDDPQSKQILGVDISSKHLRGVRSGDVVAICSPIMLARSMHVWHIKMYDERQRLCCDSRLTVVVKDKA